MSSGLIGVERPAGVSILAVLHILIGTLLVFLGLIGIAAGGVAADAGYGGFGAIFGALGAVIILIGLIPLGIGWGLWNLRKWSYQVALIFAVIAFIFGIASLPAGFLFLLIEAAILYYLTRPEIKDVFGVVGFLS